MKPSGPVFDKSWRGRSSLAIGSRQDLDWMIRRHYLGKWPGVCVLRMALVIDGTLLGTIIFALPPRETMKRYGGLTWELARLWVDDSVPKNAETWVISQAVRYIHTNFPSVKFLVSYADPSAGHSGVIYRAANWKADGRTDQDRKTPRFDYADAVTGKRYSRRKHVPIGTIIARVPRVSKNRFVYAL